MPRHDYCLEILDYRGVSEIKISFQNINSVEVFFEDSRLKTYPTLARYSFKEPVASLKAYKGIFGNYFVENSIVNHKDPRREGGCVDYEDEGSTYSDCIDQALQHIFVSAYGCNPPWISRQNQCSALVTSLSDDKLKLDTAADEVWHILGVNLWISFKIHFSPSPALLKYFSPNLHTFNCLWATPQRSQ